MRVSGALLSYKDLVMAKKDIYGVYGVQNLLDDDPNGSKCCVINRSNELNLCSGCRRGHGCGVCNAVLAGCDGTLPVPTSSDPEDHQHPGEGAQTQP